MSVALRTPLHVRGAPRLRRDAKRGALGGPARGPPITFNLVAGLDEARRALAAADTHGDDAVARLALEHLVADGADHARAGHAERMPDGDRAAVAVQLGRI